MALSYIYIVTNDLLNIRCRRKGQSFRRAEREINREASGPRLEARESSEPALHIFFRVPLDPATGAGSANRGLQNPEPQGLKYQNPENKRVRFALSGSPMATPATQDDRSRDDRQGYPSHDPKRVIIP